MVMIVSCLMSPSLRTVIRRRAGEWLSGPLQAKPEAPRERRRRSRFCCGKTNRRACEARSCSRQNGRGRRPCTAASPSVMLGLTETSPSHACRRGTPAAPGALRPFDGRHQRNRRTANNGSAAFCGEGKEKVLVSPALVFRNRMKSEGGGRLAVVVDGLGAESVTCAR